ncbi:hypothetical protein LGQ02_13925 [Bacillus shivajii]|uniref:UPF0738 family protein n=1 Tax=Bacillus shivajii TaxID=1983719 RepID=UPI001CFC417E|nr:hypothetical protein [Bacillus shivajii]UCZ51947.1 hypothetical protein LGQ02_13925 [Bacillus shivajii]
MNQSWIVEELNTSEEKIVAKAKSKETKDYLHTLKPAGQMLADSDRETFVYLLEDEEAFAHLRFTTSTWETLAAHREQENEVVLVLEHDDGNVEITLDQFWAEIGYLVENIKGNNNYGEDMVQAVENMFFK